MFILDVVGQIQVTEEHGEHEKTADGFESQIKALSRELQKHGFDSLKSGGNMVEYKRKCDCFNYRLNESVNLVNALCDEGDKMRKEEILELARKCSSLIKENKDEFYKVQEGWKLMNEVMKGFNAPLDSLLSSRGVKRRKIMSNSLYILLEAESVEKLDRLWTDYQEGALTKEFQQKLFSGKSSVLQLIITAENYRKYRNYLGRFIFSMVCPLCIT